MAPSWLVVYQGLLFIAVFLGVGILYFIRDQRGKPGFRPLLLLTVGGLIYVMTKLLVSFVRGTSQAFLFTRFNPLGAGLAAVGFTLFVLEYTGIEQPVSRRTAAFLFLVPTLVNTAVWIDVEYLWILRGQDATTMSGYAWEFTSLSIANQVYLNLVVIAGLILLTRFGLRTVAPFAIQVSTLMAAGIAPLIGNVLFYTEYVPFNLAPITIIFSAFVILWVMVRGQLLDLVPISRDVVIDSVETGVLTVDTDNQIIDINRAARQLLEVDEDVQVIGQKIETVFPDTPAAQEAYWSGTGINSGETFDLEFHGQYYEIEATDLTRANGRIPGRSYLIRDITAQRAQKQELERKNERLDQFASRVSHDLQNPLHVAEGNLELAQAEVDSEHLAAVEIAHERMRTLIDDLLRLARHGDNIEEIEQVDLASVAEATWRNVATAEATLVTETEQVIMADLTRVPQLLENLFQNAIKHGGDDVTVTVGELEDGFFVADDGAGIPSDERNKLFEAGYSTADDGTGFGLNIVQEIIKAHEWIIRVSDSDDGGARFEITAVEIVD
jgi:signal transduction histidine kinase